VDPAYSISRCLRLSAAPRPLSSGCPTSHIPQRGQRPSAPATVGGSVSGFGRPHRGQLVSAGGDNASRSGVAGTLIESVAAALDLSISVPEGSQGPP